MTTSNAEQVYEQHVKPLPAKERLRLVEKIVQDLSVAPTEDGPTQRRRWSEIRGIVSYPLCGEGAQEWVSRGRREADEQRQKQGRQEP